MRRRKNRFLLFCCSFVPGAGEMYMGFMKMGLSIMSIFIATIVISQITRLGIISMFLAVIWLYSFFNANNLGGLSMEELNRMPDRYLFADIEDTGALKRLLSGKFHKVFALVLILMGASMLWGVVCDLLYDVMGNSWYNKYIAPFIYSISTNVPRTIIAVLIIWFGIKLIQGKKEELDGAESDGMKETKEIDEKNNINN
ncbi:MAG: hypothetical protein NC313_09440 [Butyrivibrio sp.]|nr:hypothetical protein [Butyrivibrio sp.]